MITPLTEVGLFCYFIFLFFFFCYFGFFFLVFFWRGGYLGGWELTNTVLDPGFVERGGGAKRPGAHHVFKIFLDTFISYSS